MAVEAWEMRFLIPLHRTAADRCQEVTYLERRDVGRRKEWRGKIWNGQGELVHSDQYSRVSLLLVSVVRPRTSEKDGHGPVTSLL